MSGPDHDQHEQLLASLLIAYDEALDGDTRLSAQPESLIEDKELESRLLEAMSCLEVLDRLRKADDQSARDDAQPSAAAMLAPRAATRIPATIGRFRVERTLGFGGLGVVLLATEPHLGRQVAIKIPRRELLPHGEPAWRFVREAEAAARLTHPHLVALYEVGREGALCYLVSEYCPGPTLAQWLSNNDRSLGERQAAALTLKLAEAVHHAHGRGVLHRDIKPSNVMLAELAADGDELLDREHLKVSPKLTDFGMAKLLEEGGGETRTGAIIGTVTYMSPEQAEGRIDELDVRTDVYSLGAVLYEMLLDVPPYVGKTDVDTLRQMVTNEPVSPRQVRSELSRDLEAITLKCLAKNPADRYTTAHELATDLRRFLDHEPTEARPLRPWQIAVKWARRHPTIAALTTVSVLSASILLAGGALYTMRLRQHTEELRQAVTAREEAVTSREEALASARIHEDKAKRTYPSDMRLAQKAWTDGRVGDALFLLDKHMPHGTDGDHRSFAWHHLQSLCQADGRALLGHAGPVFVCRFSSDGRLLASAGEDGFVRLWDPVSATLRYAWPAAKDINAIAFSSDGKWLATTGADGQAAIWEVESRQCVHQFDAERDKVSALVFAPDCQSLIVGNATEVQLWSTANWSPHESLNGDDQPVCGLAVSSDGTMLASTSGDALIRLWDLPKRRLMATLEGHTRKVTAVAFSHQGTLLASTSQDGHTKLWDPVKRLETATFEGRGGYVRDVAFTPDDQWIVSAEDDGHAQFWERRQRAQGRATWAQNSRLYSVAVSPDGRQMVTGADDGSVRIWDGTAEPGMTRVADGHFGRAIDISPDSRLAAVGDYWGNVRLYDLTSGKLAKQLVARENQVHEICFSNRGETLVTADDDNAIRIWRYSDAALLHTLEGHRERLWSVQSSADGELLASSSNDATVKLWDSSSGMLRHDLEPGSIARGLAFAPSGASMAAACGNGKVLVWSTATGGVQANLAGHLAAIETIAWSVDGRLLASGGNDDFIFLWDARTFTALGRIRSAQNRITAIALSPDGKILASVGSDRTIKLWDVASREEMVALKGHHKEVSKVGFLKEGDLLYSLGNGNPCEFFLWPASFQGGDPN